MYIYHQIRKTITQILKIEFKSYTYCIKLLNMIIKSKLVLLIVSSIFFLVACKKIETKIDNNQGKIEQAVSFLKKKQTSSSMYQAKKIDTILQNLLTENISVIKIGEIELLLFDLKSYKNDKKLGFTNTYYKISFPIKDGKITSGLIYTIHTNFPKEQIDKDIQNILMVKSKKFTGEVVTNSINDRFVQASLVKEGRLEKTYGLQMASPKKSDQVSTTTLNENCTSYYLVTTTYYSDGHVETDWDYLYTLCGPCSTGGQPVTYIVPDCDPNSGGGGSNNVETNEVSETQIQEDVTFVSAPGIQYNYHATITRVNGEVAGVVIDPITVNNTVSWYIDNYGRNTTRTITLFNHSNSWTSLGTEALINWSCLVHGKYVYTDGSPIFTRQWGNTKSAIR
jgi:hypothetical protein